MTVLTPACVLREGESIESERVMRNVGPALVPGVHAMWERGYGPGSNLGLEDPDLAGEYDRYIRQYGDRRSPPTPDDRRYLDVHEGHYSYLKEGEEQFVSPEMLAASLTGTGREIERRLASLTGTGREIERRLDEMESIGIDNVALAAVDRQAALELIADFSEQVIQRRR